MSDVIQARARGRVGLDARVSRAALAAEVTRLRQGAGLTTAGFRASAPEQLTLVYDWLDRVLPYLASPTTVDDHTVFARLGSGVDVPRSVEVPCGPLTAYENPVRQWAMEQCGWARLPSAEQSEAVLKAVAARQSRGGATIVDVARELSLPQVTACCEEGDYERAAAIAVLNGFTGPTVAILSQAADAMRQHLRQVAFQQYARMMADGGMLALTAGERERELAVSRILFGPDAMHAELLHLTAMAIAGCPGPVDADTDTPSGWVGYDPATRALLAQRAANRQVWLSTTRMLQQRVKGHRHPYLKIVLTVLLEVADPQLDTMPMTANASPAVQYVQGKPASGNVPSPIAPALSLSNATLPTTGAARSGSDSATGSAATTSTGPRRPQWDTFGTLNPRNVHTRAGGTGTTGDFGGSGTLRGIGGESITSSAHLHGSRGLHASPRVGSPALRSVGPGGMSGPGGGGAGRGGGGAGASSQVHASQRSHSVDVAKPSTSSLLAPPPSATAGGMGSSTQGEGAPVPGLEGITLGEAALPAPPPPPHTGRAASAPSHHSTTMSPSFPAPVAASSGGGAASAPGMGGPGITATTVASAAASLFQEDEDEEDEQIEISLHDRVAFACRFLADGKLKDYIVKFTLECMDAGRIDGLLLTGLTPRGARLVQHYVDDTADVQTAAVVGVYMLRAAQLRVMGHCTREVAAGRALPPSPAAVLPALPPDLVAMVSLSWRWVQAYREMLTRLQLWHQRATFDIQRNKLLGLKYKGYVPTIATMAARAGAPPSVEEQERYAFNALLAACAYSDGLSPQPSTIPIATAHPSATGGTFTSMPRVAEGPYTLELKSADGMLGLGPRRSQMFVRCHNCAASLSLPALVEGSASSVEWLSKQRPYMLSCPHCKRTLPRCSLCLLPLGCINPVLQLTHEMSQRHGARVDSGAFDAIKSPTMVPGMGATGRSGTNVGAGGVGMGGLPGSGGGVGVTPTGVSTSPSTSSLDITQPGQLRDAMNFDDFWCWCQSCRHGGHASHLAEWFASKTVCPVAECMCHCIRMDGFAAALKGIPPHLLKSGSIAKWGMPFTGGVMGSVATGGTSTGSWQDGGATATESTANPAPPTTAATK